MKTIEITYYKIIHLFSISYWMQSWTLFKNNRSWIHQQKSGENKVNDRVKFCGSPLIINIKEQQRPSATVFTEQHEILPEKRLHRERMRLYYEVLASAHNYYQTSDISTNEKHYNLKNKNFKKCFFKKKDPDYIKGVPLVLRPRYTLIDIKVVVVS